MDIFSKEQRSRIMARVHSKDTRPELIVRKLIHALGYRFRLHRKDLPGKPDIVFPSRKKAIFVHGCFWHQHSCKRGRRIPATRKEYWIPKLEKNRRRDMQNQRKLKALGWDVLVIWECQIKNPPFESLARRIYRFLEK